MPESLAELGRRNSKLAERMARRQSEIADTTNPASQTDLPNTPNGKSTNPNKKEKSSIKKRWDPNQQRYYYYDKKTRRTSWVAEELIPESAGSESTPASSELEPAAQQMQPVNNPETAGTTPTPSENARLLAHLSKDSVKITPSENEVSTVPTQPA